MSVNVCRDGPMWGCPSERFSRGFRGPTASQVQLHLASPAKATATPWHMVRRGTEGSSCSQLLLIIQSRERCPNPVGIPVQWMWPSAHWLRQAAYFHSILAGSARSTRQRLRFSGMECLRRTAGGLDPVTAVPFIDGDWSMECQWHISMSMNKGDLLVTKLTCSESQWTVQTDRKELQQLLKRHACFEAVSASANKYEGPIRGDASDGTAVAGGSRSLFLIRVSACMFWHHVTKITAGVSRYLPPGHSECGLSVLVSRCRPKGPANLVGLLDLSHLTRRYHGTPRSTGQCSQWSGVHVCIRKCTCFVSLQIVWEISVSKTRTDKFLRCIFQQEKGSSPAETEKTPTPGEPPEACHIFLLRWGWEEAFMRGQILRIGVGRIRWGGEHHGRATAAAASGSVSLRPWWSKTWRLPRKAGGWCQGVVVLGLSRRSPRPTPPPVAVYGHGGLVLSSGPDGKVLPAVALRRAEWRWPGGVHGQPRRAAGCLALPPSERACAPIARCAGGPPLVFRPGYGVWRRSSTLAAVGGGADDECIAVRLGRPPLLAPSCRRVLHLDPVGAACQPHGSDSGAFLPHFHWAVAPAARWTVAGVCWQLRRDARHQRLYEPLPRLDVRAAARTRGRRVSRRLPQGVVAAIRRERVGGHPVADARPQRLLVVRRGERAAGPAAGWGADCRHVRVGDQHSVGRLCCGLKFSGPTLRIGLAPNPPPPCRPRATLEPNRGSCPWQPHRRRPASPPTRARGGAYEQAPPRPRSRPIVRYVRCFSLPPATFDSATSRGAHPWFFRRHSLSDNPKVYDSIGKVSPCGSINQFLSSSRHSGPSLL